MDTSNLIPVETVIGQSYCVTTDTPCSVSAQLKGRMMLLLSIQKGQGVFIAPAQTVYLTADAHVTKSFNGAAPTAQGGGNSEITDATEDSPSCFSCEMTNQGWCVIGSNVTRVCVRSNSAADGTVCSMVLEVKPEDVVLENGWLTAQTENGEAVEVRWIAGEPAFPASGLSYIIGLTRRTPSLILANLLATY